MSNRPRRSYLTTSIPYVNAPPHVGHALEFVEADVLARVRRAQGGAVRLQSGTDDHALKNVRAADAAGVTVAEHVNANAEVFAELCTVLGLTLDDTIRTSADPRHAPAVRALWAACESAGDLYRKDYQGLYCVGCEEFYAEEDLDSGLCPEHLVAPEVVTENNWFFRLERHADALRGVIERGDYRIQPAGPRNEVLALIDSGLEDFSVSRAAERARGWGIEVPGDPTQVVAVWFDALANYLSALSYGGDAEASMTGGGSSRTSGSMSSAKAFSASTPCTGPPSSCRPAFPCRQICSSTSTSLSTGARSASHWGTPSIHWLSFTSTGRMPSAGGWRRRCR